MGIGHSGRFGFLGRKACQCKYPAIFVGQESVVRDFFVSVACLVKPFLTSGTCTASSSRSNITAISLIQFRVIRYKKR